MRVCKNVDSLDCQCTEIDNSLYFSACLHRPSVHPGRQRLRQTLLTCSMHSPQSCLLHMDLRMPGPLQYVHRGSFIMISSLRCLVCHKIQGLLAMSRWKILHIWSYLYCGINLRMNFCSADHREEMIKYLRLTVFQKVIPKLILVIDGWGILCKIAARWLSWELHADQTLVVHYW